MGLLYEKPPFFVKPSLPVFFVLSGSVTADSGCGNALPEEITKTAAGDAAGPVQEENQIVIIYAPDEYLHFHCIAGACRHTCCVGWEIDIDDASLQRYQNMEGRLGEKLRRNIALLPSPHFVLSPEERCPFLTGENLCELILGAGEDALCQICTDHPRFRNYWSDRMEIGLGLACEEAARLMLSSDHPLRLVPLGEDPEEVAEEPSEEEIALRQRRDQLLAAVPGSGPAARLREYLLYRHVADALYDGLLEQRIRFAELAADRILSGWNGKSLPDLIERARSFSNEVEYDDEKLRSFLSK